MACPEFYYFIRPCLDAVAQNPGLHWREIGELASAQLKLSQTDREERIASGNRTKYEDRVQWALTYLRQAKLIEKIGRGKNQITSQGASYLKRAPKVIKPADLNEFPDFVKFHEGEGDSKKSQADQSKGSSEIDVTPIESMTTAYQTIRSKLATELLDQLKAVTPERFERIIVDLMLKLGYGGPRDDAGQTLGRTGDGGVDGIIRQDQLGLDNIYLQAKRWSGNSVGVGDVNGFIGALTTRGANKGVFITTSNFSEQALKVASSAPHLKLSLINGTELARLMIDHDLGVALEVRFDAKRIDSDYFTEE